MGATIKGITFPEGGNKVAVHTDLQATATTTDIAIGEAVGALAADPRLPTTGTFRDGDYLLIGLDANGNPTDLALDVSDGQVSEWVMDRWRSRLRIQQHERAGVLWAVLDDAGNPTDLVIRASDGQLADFAVARLAARIGPLIGAGGPVQRVNALAGWGSSTMALLHPHLAALAASAGLPWYGGGQGGETMAQTAARIGSTPALLTFPGGIIPATGSVTVTSPTMPYGVFLRAFAGTVAGVPGMLSVSGGAYLFTRSTPGDPVAVPAAGAPFIPVDGMAHRADTTLLQVGKNSLTQGVAGDVVAADTVAVFEHLTPSDARCLVIGHFVDGGTPATSAIRDRIMACNAALRAHFGDAMFLDVHAWVTSDQLWADTGITPTQADRDAQAIGNKPPSVSLDNGHFNDAGNTALTALIAGRMTSLGWL